MSLWRCKHEWQELERHYSPPVRGSHLKNVDYETVQMAMFGITNITQQCTVCGRTDVTTVTGKV